MKRFGLGLGLGLLLGGAGAALAYPLAKDGGDHYEMGWSVLVRGQLICQDPFVRPSEREIECRSAKIP